MLTSFVKKYNPIGLRYTRITDRLQASGYSWLILISFLIITVSCRQENYNPFENSFIKFFGQNIGNEGVEVKTLDNGGYAILANTWGTNRPSEILLIITDRHGNQITDPVRFGGSTDFKGHALTTLHDGGFAITGSISDEAGGGSSSKKALLIRTDDKGNELWSRTYDYGINPIGYDIAETSEGGFIIIGTSERFFTRKTDIFLLKTDSRGETEWTRIYGGWNDDDAGYSIAETSYGFIYAGYTKSFSQSGQSNSNIFIVKTNHQGLPVHAYTYGGYGDDYGSMIIPHLHGGLLLLGTTSEPGSGIRNVFLCRIDEDITSPLWTRTFGDSISHKAASMKITDKGDIIITGTRELSEDNHVIFLLKTDPEGNEIFLKTFGGSGFQTASSVDLAPNGGYIITGINRQDGKSVITLIKTDENGELR